MTKEMKRHSSCTKTIIRHLSLTSYVVSNVPTVTSPSPRNVNDSQISVPNFSVYVFVVSRRVSSDSVTSTPTHPPLTRTFGKSGSGSLTFPQRVPKHHLLTDLTLVLTEENGKRRWDDTLFTFLGRCFMDSTRFETEGI